MSDEYLEMCNDLTNLISNEENISGNSVFEILKKYYLLIPTEKIFRNNIYY